MTTYVVNTLADENDGIATGGVSLRDAINAANANPGGDRIVFADGLSGTITLTQMNGELAITDALSINGDANVDGVADITVSGDTNSNGNADFSDVRIFNISADTRIETIVLADGYANNQSGGGILHTAGDLVVDNVTFNSNQVFALFGTATGGAIASTGGTLTVEDSVVRRQHGDHQGRRHLGDRRDDGDRGFDVHRQHRDPRGRRRRLQRRRRARHPRHDLFRQHGDQRHGLRRRRVLR